METSSLNPRTLAYSACIVFVSLALMLAAIAAWEDVSARPTYKQCGCKCRVHSEGAR